MNSPARGEARVSKAAMGSRATRLGEHTEKVRIQVK